MQFYERRVLPHLIDVVCAGKQQRRQREKVVPLASGRVLEIGFGSGLNLPFYTARSVDKLWGLDPSAGMQDLAQRRLPRARMPVELLPAPAEAIPLDDRSVDTVVMTYTLCSLPDLPGAMSEIRRVLRPGGRLLFCEHGAAPEARVLRWQQRLNPLWRRVSGGCNLDRPIPQLIESHGFQIRALQRGYVPGWKPASYNYWGEACASGSGS